MLVFVTRALLLEGNHRRGDDVDSTLEDRALLFVSCFLDSLNRCPFFTWRSEERVIHVQVVLLSHVVLRFGALSFVLVVDRERVQRLNVLLDLPHNQVVLLKKTTVTTFCLLLKVVLVKQIPGIFFNILRFPAKWLFAIL